MNESVKVDDGQVRAINVTIVTHASQLDTEEKTTWILAFGVLLVVATVGNSLVTWFIIGKKMNKNRILVRLFRRDILTSDFFESQPYISNQFLPRDQSSPPAGQSPQLLYAELNNGGLCNALFGGRLQFHLHSRWVNNMRQNTSHE
jgi:hypothetical protein